MSSTLIISDEASCMPQTGTFESALEFIAEELKPIDETLANQLLEPIGAFPYLDLTDLDQDQYSRLVNATVAIFNRILSEWNTDQGFPMDMRAFIQFKQYFYLILAVQVLRVMI